MIKKKDVEYMDFSLEGFKGTSGEMTAREILQQPCMWRMTSQRVLEAADEIKALFNKAFFHSNIRVCFAGAGSSAFCGELVSAAVNKYFGFRTEALHTTDIVSAPETVLYANVPTLLISFARSGNSPESVAAVQYARKYVKTLYELAITCAADGALNKITEGENRLSLLLPKETCDEGFAMTSSLTSMAVAAYGCFALLAEKNDEYCASVESLAGEIDQKMSSLAQTANDAVCSMDFNRIAYLGSGVLKGAAHEATVKMCELTAGVVNVVYDTPMGFRHGPKSMITDKTYTMYMISGDTLTRRYDTDAVNEVTSERDIHRKGNKVIALGVDIDSIGCDVRVSFSDRLANDFYTAIAGVLFAQLLSFCKSRQLGVPTDNPCPTGEVNRVVSGVTLY